MQMNEVEITKTVNCLIKSLVSPPTCDASSISSPESFYLSKAAIKSKSWIEMRKCFSFSASSYFYKVEQREENLGPCKFLLCLEDMIQRILMACRFQIAVIPRWEGRLYRCVESMTTLPLTTNGFVKRPKFFVIWVMLFLIRHSFHRFNYKVLH